MQTVFSHIVQKRFSQEGEDVATDALAFILDSSESARNGMIKLLRGIDPSLPALRFETQLAEGSIRPDMWGLDGGQPRVFIENKFWAGLTENQPVSYLQQLAEHTQPSVLLVVAPETRVQTLWRELGRRLQEGEITATDRRAAAGILHSATTDIGPVLATTSWTRLISALELEVADDPAARSDLLQLRSLCVAADSDSFVPVSLEELTNQRTPAFMLQLGSILQLSCDLAESEGVSRNRQLRPMSNWNGFGRYMGLFGGDPWFGVHFGLWKTHGSTPLWLILHQNLLEWLSEESSTPVRPLFESWAAESGAFITAFQKFGRMGNGLAIAVDITAGEDKDLVVRNVVDQLKAIGDVVSVPNPTPAEANEE